MCRDQGVIWECLLGLGRAREGKGREGKGSFSVWTYGHGKYALRAVRLSLLGSSSPSK